MSSIVNGLIIGNMALYIFELNKKNQFFQQKLDTVNTSMNHLMLPVDLRRKILEFFIKTHALQEMQDELRIFMKKRITHSYQVHCSIYIFKWTLKHNAITSHLMLRGKENKNHNLNIVENFCMRMEVHFETPE